MIPYHDYEGAEYEYPPHEDVKLKPCPFCGSEAKVWQGMFGGWRAFCTNRKSCGAMIVCATEQDAIIEWNKRVPPTDKDIEEYIEKTHKENMELVTKLKRKYEVAE